MERNTAAAGGLLDLDAMIAHAKSDARFDGVDWDQLSGDDRQSYLLRVQAGYEAAAREILAHQTKP